MDMGSISTRDGLGPHGGALSGLQWVAGDHGK